MMKKILINLVVSFFMIFIFLGCNEPDTSMYKGDGEIIPLGWNYHTRGYKILFDSFDLNKMFVKDYKITDLPESEKTYWVGLEIISEDEDIQKDLKGTFSVNLESIDGKKVFDCSAPLLNWKKSQVKLDENRYYNFFYYFSNENENSFKFKNLSSSNHVLHIEYNPLSTERNINALVQLKVGGEK